jgi:tetratricopeptide (TPR) repeat protein
MARAAVKAKQQAAKAKAQPTRSRARGRRRHRGGGNPNQQLFFVRLRRGQRWLYALLAVVFALTFAGVGVGSGTGGLSQLYSGLFGAGGDAVSKAKSEIKKNPAQGYRDLATAYETKGDMAQAMSALRSYLNLNKRDANVWSELGGLELSQAQTYGTQFQQAQQSAQLADPSQAFQPSSGTLAQAIGPNAAYQGASQQATSATSALSQQATASMAASETAYKKAAKIQPRSGAAQQQLAVAAENAGDYKLALTALRRFLKLSPNAPGKGQIKSQIKQLEKALQPANSSATVHSSNGGK